MKKFLTLFLGMLAAVALAAPGAWAEYYDDNTGDSEADAYVIDSEADLRLMAQRVNDGSDPSGKYYRLGADITLNMKW
ncbi:MAG: hypothetical protein IJR68_03075 [Fretibacterium sp.]|nr:hypothetical protein [Fretibacterium sp.]